MQIPIIGLSFESDRLLEKLADLLNKDFTNLKFYRKGNAELPDDAYNNFRDQYLAGRVLDHLREEGIKIWVTQRDIYGKGSNYVFGETEYRGPILLSTKRLKPEFYDEKPDSDVLLNRLRKECIHELGHSFGLKHCDNENCVMRFSNSIKAVDEKNKEFCEECQVEISTQGLPLE